MLLSLRELFDIAVMTFAIGFIFSSTFEQYRRKAVQDYDPLIHARLGFSMQRLWFAAAVVAPAIIFHELGHKLVAMGYGLPATFHAAYSWLALGIVLKLLNFGFIFFVPAFVSFPATVTPLQSSLIAFAGPGVNLVLWLSALALLRYPRMARRIGIRERHLPILALTGRINMFLFIFNMLPLPFFDGAKVFSGLLSLF